MKLLTPETSVMKSAVDGQIEHILRRERDNSSVALQWAPDRKRTGREGNKFHRGEPL